VRRNRGAESSSTILGLPERVVVRVDDVVGEWMKSDKCNICDTQPKEAAWEKSGDRMRLNPFSQVENILEGG
jgi:hypothetical protein